LCAEIRKHLKNDFDISCLVESLYQDYCNIDDVEECRLPEISTEKKNKLVDKLVARLADGENKDEIVLIEGPEVLSNNEPWKRIQEIYDFSYYLDTGLPKIEPAQSCDELSFLIETKECDFIRDLQALNRQQKEQAHAQDSKGLNVVRFDATPPVDHVDEFMRILKHICKVENVTLDCQPGGLKKLLRL